MKSNFLPPTITVIKFLKAFINLLSVMMRESYQKFMGQEPFEKLHF